MPITIFLLSIAILLMAAWHFLKMTTDKSQTTTTTTTDKSQTTTTREGFASFASVARQFAKDPKALMKSTVQTEAKTRQSAAKEEEEEEEDVDLQTKDVVLDHVTELTPGTNEYQEFAFDERSIASSFAIPAWPPAPSVAPAPAEVAAEFVRYIDPRALSQVLVVETSPENF